jgi:SRSO17 transposase
MSGRACPIWSSAMAGPSRSRVGDATPDKTQRLLNHARWDTAGVVSVVRRFVISGLDGAGGPGGLRIGVLDETGQQKTGAATAGVKRQYMGCAGRVANGINLVLRHEAQVCIPRTARRDWRYISGSDG